MSHSHRNLSSGPPWDGGLSLLKPRKPPSKSLAQRLHWGDARRFQDRVHAALSRHGFSFMEWLLLETVQELIDETDDAVSQADVARRTGASERVISYWMLRMTRCAAVDRAPTADGRAWRVILTSEGRRRRDECNQRLEATRLTE